MFNNSKVQSVPVSKEAFVKQAEDARQQRLLDRKKNQMAIIIQKTYRGYKCRQIEYEKQFLKLSNSLSLTEIGTASKYTANELYEFGHVYLFLNKLKAINKKNEQIFAKLCTHLALSIHNGDFKHSYVSLIISKTLYKNFLDQSRQIIQLCIKQMNFYAHNLKVKDNYYKFEIYLNLLLSLVTVSKWKCFKKTAEKSNFINNNTVNNDTNKLVETMLNGTAKNYLSLLHSQGIYKVFNNCLNIHLNNHKLILTAQNLTSILTLSVQILTSSSYLPNVLNDFSSEILTVPTVIKELLTLKTQPQAETILIECNLSCRLYPMLSKRNEDLTNSSNSSSFIEGMNFLQGVSFLGNLCSIELLDFDSFKLNVHNFLVIATQIIEHCSKLLLSSTDQTKNTLINCDSTTNSEMIITWTPLFGYLKLKLSNSLCFNDLLEQLRFLWSHKFILLLFFESPDTLLQISAANEQQAKKELNLKSLMRSLFDKSSSLQQKQQLNTSHIVFRICSFYKKILVLMSEPKIEILCSLSFEEEFLLGIWKYFCTLEVKELVKIIDKDKCFTHPIFDVLYVLASLILYLFTIFDEEEVFTQQKFLTRDDFRKLASFLNQFLYEIVVSMAQTEANLEKNNYFVLWHELLLVIYDKDCKQSTREQMEQFWVIKDIKIKSFMNDLSRGKANSSILLSRMPHVIPLKHRIEIMQAEIVRDKERLEYANVRIKVRRNRIIEDGIDQINGLPSLKSTIRVKMINEHGLNEAGIDQDGVFKEFLLDVIKKILNPEFNLFQLTDEQQVYPSSCSYFMDDHLNMFEFVGKLIGKAVYEGHVIDVQFAPFFLRQIIGGCNNSNYSFVDDLASLDKQLYKNLRSIRSCDQVDVLELTFTHSEMHLGQLVTNELVPGGSDIKVLNDNKIRYIHLLAHFKLHKQIRQQIIAFNKGFKSIIKQDWLNSFTLNEIQTLISGSTVDLDCDDLKDNVQYWGGLHAQHRLIKWLWDIIEFDFNRNERALFLKFVTSSARPPLLGFSSLNPQFTIRSVENEEEDGTIYDASFKGFFKTMLNIGNDKETLRLPTSSTCFNLLKLPNYNKKSTLRERLRYAISSNSGFELS